VLSNIDRTNGPYDASSVIWALFCRRRPPNHRGRVCRRCGCGRCGSRGPAVVVGNYSSCLESLSSLGAKVVAIVVVAVVVAAVVVALSLTLFLVI